MPRKRSSDAHAKVIEAAIALISQLGIEGTSMDAIVRLSGVSKATVYRHWKDKEALCIDLIRELGEKLPEFDSGNARKDLTALVRYLSRANKNERLMAIWPRIIGYAMSNRAFGEALREHSFGPRRTLFEKIVKRAQGKGQLRPDMDLRFAMDLLVGPVIHRRFVEQKAPRGLAEQIVEVFWMRFALPVSHTQRAG